MADPISAINEATDLASVFNITQFYPQDFKSGSFRNHENKKLFYLKAPAIGEVKARAVYTTGYAGSVNLDYDTIGKLQARGIEVYAMDWVNQGLSDRENPKDLRDSNSRLLTRNMLDLEKFITDVVPTDAPGTAPLPLLYVTHSMGGNIGMLHMKHFPNTFDGAILAAPMLDLNNSIVPRPLFKGIINVLDRIGFGDYPLPDFRSLLNRIKATTKNINDLTAHPENLTLTEKAQLRVQEVLKPIDIKMPKLQGVRQFYPVMDEMRRDGFYHDIETPTLLIAGHDDELVSNKVIRRAAASLPHGYLLTLEQTGHGVWTTTNQKDETILDARIDQFLTQEMRNPVKLPVPMPSLQNRPPSPPPPNLPTPVGNPGIAASRVALAFT